MKIIKYAMLTLLALALASCSVFEWDSYAMVRVQNFSSRNIYEVNLENIDLGSLARKASSLYYSIDTRVNYLSIKLSPYSEWKEYFLDKVLVKDRRYSIIIFDDDSLFSDEFEIQVYEDYESGATYTPTPTPAVTATPVPDTTSLYLVEMYVDNEYFSMTTNGFFEFDSSENEYQLIEWNDDFTLIITLPLDVEPSRVYLGSGFDLPLGFDFAMDNNRADQYYLLGEEDFMFAVLDWDYADKEFSVIFGGELKIAGTDDYVTISKGVISRID